MSARRLATVLAALTLFSLAHTVVANADDKLTINEVCPVFTQGVADSDPGAWIELHNPTREILSAHGVRIADANLAQIALLPSIQVPPNAFLVVHLGTGTNDFDAADGRMDYYVGRTTGTQMPWNAGAVAVFRGKILRTNLSDFTAWGTQPLAASRALDWAISMGMWEYGRFVDLTNSSIGSSFGLAASGFDRDEASPWSVFTGRIGAALPSPGTANALMGLPRPGEIVPLGTSPALWTSTKFPGSETFYLVDLDRVDEAGNRINVVEDLVLDTEISLPVGAEGEYVWRIDPAEDGSPSGVASEQSFFAPAANANATLQVELPVPYLENLKDTRLLCCYNLATTTRPGCADTHWNIPHAPDATNDHDAFYSARAAIAMVNRYYGGNLSQDRISYEVFKGRFPGAEGDLGHGVGLTTAQITAAYRWALGGVLVNFAPWAPPFDYLRAEIDAGRPVLLTTTAAQANRECALISGYAILRLYNLGPPMPAVKVLNPREGRTYWILYSFYSGSIMAHWQIGGPPTAILQEASIGADSDADGVMDFDETPGSGRFGSSATSADSDGDLIADLAEIYCYTFHDAMHPGHSNDAASFSDVDGDARRSEFDTDSDNGGLADGMEDLDRDGIAPEGGETCPYLATDGGMPNAPPPSATREAMRPELAVLAPVHEGAVRIRFDLPRADRVSLVVFAPDGRVCAALAADDRRAGPHEVAWDGRDGNGNRAPAGIYLLRLATETQGNRAIKLPYLP